MVEWRAQPFQRRVWQTDDVVFFDERCVHFWRFPDFLPKHFLNGIFVIGTLAKAFFIVAEFMHLKYEIRNLIMSIAVPAMLFIWFLTAFLWDGNSYKNLRNRYDQHHLESGKPVKEKPGENKPEAKKPGVE